MFPSIEKILIIIRKLKSDQRIMRACQKDTKVSLKWLPLPKFEKSQVLKRIITIINFKTLNF